MSEVRGVVWVENRARGAVSRASCGLAITLMVLSGCAHSQTPSPTQHTPAESSDASLSQPSGNDEELQVTGIMGSLSDYEIAETMDRRLDAFLNCFARRAGRLKFLSGKLEMVFRVRSSGRVRWVYPQSSTIGDRATESCILNAAKATKFPRPYGGEVEFAFPIELDLIDQRRAPNTWQASRIDNVIDENRAGVAEQCELEKRESFQLTVYIGKGGQVLAAGGAVNDAENLSHLDCVTEAVRSWEMPDPGKRPSKVAFAISN